MDTPLSKDKALDFLQNILHIENPMQQISQKTRLEFLNYFIHSWFQNVPFQNVEQIFLSNKENRSLTVAEIIQTQMQGKGGMCIYNAIFCHHILAALDYDVHFSISTGIIHRDHVVVIANSVMKPEDSYLVEVGCGWPTFQAIQLDNLTTDLASCIVYFDKFLEYTYIREDDLVVRYHRKGDFLVAPCTDYKDGWRRQSHIEMRPVSIEFLYSDEANIIKTLKDLEGVETKIMLSPMIVSYPEEHFTAISHGYLHYEVDGERNRKQINNKEEMLQICRKNFPMVDIDILGQVVDMTKDKTSSVE